MKTLSMALAALAVSASSALAVTFDFTTLPTASFGSQTYTESGVSITATAQSGQSGPLVAQKDSPSFIRGLGVIDDIDTVGSIDRNQILDLVIPVGYKVTSVEMVVRGNPPQSFDILLDNVFAGTNTITSANNNSTDGRTVFDVSGLPVASMFSLRANSATSGGVWMTGLTLASLNTVPLPAGVVLLGGALAVGGVATRRKAKAA